ncbi:aldehyde dehydrogenase [Acidisoma cladoniae]|uniref:aldehyde dehydrogenase n=1 Tax=Acidisoma cladoniae TaxID=3040935 RepID=UPI00254B9CC9|nr:aldehyde dehydrogenase [Acidisoma sp. PAMC 29798]
MQDYKMLIGGEWVDAAAGETFESIDPYTGEVWARLPRGRAEDAARAVEAAEKAGRGEWSKLTATARGHVLRRFGDEIAAHADHLARIEVQDNGKLLAEMLAQVRYVPQWFYYFAGLADKLEGAVIPIDKANTFNFTRHEPLGVCIAITAWNSPLLLAAYKLAPGLAAGNTFVLKPSEFTSASALEMGRLAEKAGLPPGVLNIVTGFGAEVGEPLVTHPKVAKIAFTGSEMGGQRVYEAAARGLKRVTLELGGKSPNIVFDDANLDNAVKGVISGILSATGQTCVAGSRLLVQRSIHDAFLERVIAFAKTAKIGNPMLAGTQIGPVTTRPQYEKILHYIDVAKNEGARCVLGGGPAPHPEGGKGLFVQPTIFADVRNDMRIAQEEVFGPVLSVIPFEDEAEALAIANDSIYGLAAGVWTQNTNRVLRMSAGLKTGMVWVNMYRAVSYMSPFGGTKRSGVGSENGMSAIMDYVQTKSVWISTAEETPDPFVLG